MSPAFPTFFNRSASSYASGWRRTALVFSLGIAASWAAQAQTCAVDVSDGDITGPSCTGVTYTAPVITIDNTATAEISITGTSSGANAHRVVVTGGTHAIVFNGVDIDTSAATDSSVGAAFAITGGANVTLVLADGSANVLTSGGSNAGLEVSTSTDGNTVNTLRIEGQTADNGALSATGGGVTEGGAGIGSSPWQDSGAITIAGGRITAQGVYHGAGIGGGRRGAGNVTISGGTIVNAQGGSFGAGIGGGDFGAGDVTITGGTIVNAQGGSTGAGIGGGYNRAGNVTITGGTIVNAQGGFQGAGIGGGVSGTGEVTITGGTIENAQGGERSAGIGGGYNRAGNVTITGGTIVNAQGGIQGAGIGGGYAGAGDVTITGGSIYAVKGAENGSQQDVGGGNTALGTSTVRNAAGEDVFISTITLTGISTATAIDTLSDSIIGSSYAYGLSDVRSNATGQIFVYLPDAPAATPPAIVKVEANGTAYCALYPRNSASSYNVTANNANCASVITLNANGGTSGVLSSLLGTIGDSVTLPAASGWAPPIGFGALLGWGTAANGTGTNYAEDSSITMAAPLTLYALWGAAIATQPQDSTVNEGDSATFSVTANGTGVLSYQWQQSTDGTTWTDITGATSSSYTRAAATVAADDGLQLRVQIQQALTIASTTPVPLVSQAARLSVQAVAVPAAVPVPGLQAGWLVLLGLVLAAFARRRGPLQRRSSV